MVEIILLCNKTETTLRIDVSRAAKQSLACAALEVMKHCHKFAMQVTDEALQESAKTVKAAGLLMRG